MSIRKCALAAAGLLAATTLVGTGLSTAGAAGNGGLPFITGGGHTQNNNSTGGTQPELTTFGGFNARAIEEPANEGDPYLARGEVQGRTSDNATHKTVGKVHGNVVCMANLGPADAESGGAEGVDVWEIRFEIERSDPPQDSPVPLYGSLVVQDNGPHNDFADESFANVTSPDCGQVSRYQLEPHQGQITVHNGG